MLDRERKRVPDHRSDVLKGSLPHGPPAHPSNTEYPGIGDGAKRARRRVEMKKLRDSVEANKSYFALNPAAD